MCGIDCNCVFNNSYKNNIDMKANELMIGNWVYSSFSELPCKITYLKLHESGYGSVVTTNVDGVKDIESLSPVPLTSDILEKNGHKIIGYSVWDLDCGAEVQWVPETLNSINPRMQYRLVPRQKEFGVQDTLICHIKYVHQLQNALRLCGIEKTIEL